MQSNHQTKNEDIDSNTKPNNRNKNTALSEIRGV